MVQKYHHVAQLEIASPCRAEDRQNRLFRHPSFVSGATLPTASCSMRREMADREQQGPGIISTKSVTRRAPFHNGTQARLGGEIITFWNGSPVQGQDQ